MTTLPPEHDWCPQPDSNWRPIAYKAIALPLCYTGETWMIPQDSNLYHADPKAAELPLFERSILKWCLSVVTIHKSLSYQDNILPLN